MNTPLTILGIAGSLRKASYNQAALRAAQELTPEGAKTEIFDLDGIPPFNQDQENPAPAAVAQFKARIRAADAILIATPEYNYSIPGVLKNAIDWASRPYGDSAWEGKPAAILGASPAANGTARAQYHLRQVFVYLNIHTLNKPEVMIGNVHQLFDQAGNLTDEKTKKNIRELVESLVKYTHQLERGRTAAGAEALR